MPSAVRSKRRRGASSGRQPNLKSTVNSSGSRTQNPARAADSSESSTDVKSEAPRPALAEQLYPHPAKPCPTDGRLLRILIADDHPVVREGLSAIIRRQGNMLVIAEAADGEEAVQQFDLQQPDIAILDLRMPRMDGVEAVAAICQKQPEARLAVLIGHESEEEIYRALKAGAKGFAVKNASASELMKCVCAVSEGKMWIPPGIGTMLAKRVAIRDLTPRELEVLRELAAGKSNKEVGSALGITEGTVKMHVAHLLEKLDAGGRTEAISLALKRGLIIMVDAVCAS